MTLIRTKMEAIEGFGIKISKIMRKIMTEVSYDPGH